jgi:phosphoribosylformylglycinamidine synthase
MAAEENLEATSVARVTEDPRMVMTLNGKTFVSLSRRFLASNGAAKFTDASIESPVSAENGDRGSGSGRLS